jgi:endonuclease/exonuclease/phosphatase (EEP) superfamily protein YafD
MSGLFSEQRQRHPSWAWLLLALSLFPLVIILIAQTSRWWWIGELVCHWQVHAVLCLLPVMVVFRRDPWWGRLFFIVLILGLFPSVQVAFAPRAEPSSSAESPAINYPVSVLSANISVQNQQRSAFYSDMMKYNAEIIVLIEVSGSDRDYFLTQKETWPHQEWGINGKGPYGMAVLSRHRFVDTAIHRVDGFASLEILIDLGDVPLRLFAVHPPPPLNEEWVKSRDRVMATVARRVKEISEPAIVIGDWNCTINSPLWPTLSNYAGWKSAPGMHAATWPSWLGPFGITIDNVVAKSCALDPVKTFTISGSDHRGIITTVRVPEEW